MLQTTKDEWIIRQIRNHMRGAGIPVEFSKGEFGKGQHEINITYSDALSNADHHSLYKHGVKEIAALNGVSATFMAKWTMDEAGSSCHLHSSIWNAKGTKSLTWSDEGVGNMTDEFRWYLGGIMATAREMSWMYAPFVNSYKRYQLASWAPTAIVWSRDNRTAGYRTVGEHAAFRVECRIPGADANPYLAFAATVAAGMWGIENKVEPPPMFEGNAYEAKRVPRVPTSLHEAIDVFRKSKAAKEMFGDFVYGHLLNTAVQEQSIFDNLDRDRLGARPLLRAGLSAVLEPALDAILRSVPGWADAEFDVAPLEGGITNRNYVVTVERVAVRVAGARARHRAARHRPGERAQGGGRGRRRRRRARGRGVPSRERMLRVAVRRRRARSPGRAALGRRARARRGVGPRLARLSPDPVDVPGVPHRRALPGDGGCARGVAIPPAYDEAHALADRIEAAFASVAVAAHDVPQRPAERELPA